MRPLFYVRVHGHPIPKGSMRCIRAAGGFCRSIPYSNDKQRQQASAWEKAVAVAVGGRLWEDHVPLAQACQLDITFYINPPGSKPPDGPRHHRRQGPDIDKLVRSVLDVLTDCGVWDDDGRCAVVRAQKLWATDQEPPGAVFQVSTWPQEVATEP